MPSFFLFFAVLPGLTLIWGFSLAKSVLFFRSLFLGMRSWDSGYPRLGGICPRQNPGYPRQPQNQ